jgi:hypothetical protein
MDIFDLYAWNKYAINAKEHESSSQKHVFYEFKKDKRTLKKQEFQPGHFHSLRPTLCSIRFLYPSAFLKKWHRQITANFTIDKIKTESLTKYKRVSNHVLTAQYCEV